MAIRHTDHREWEVEPSTRTSMHPHTKYNPFRAATSTTASTIFTLAAGGVATNLITNPSIEHATISMYTAVGSAIARVTSQAASGAASLECNPANSAAKEGFYWDIPTVPFSVHPQHITIQAEHRGASAASAVILELRDATGASVLGTSGSSNLATSWVRVTASYTVPPSTEPAAYRLYLVTAADHNITFYADKLMCEFREDTNAVSTYVDGAQGLNHEWTGTAHLSPSYKRFGSSSIRGIKVVNESGTANEIVFVAFDTVATSTTGVAVIAGGTFETNWPIDFRSYVSVIAANGTPTISGVVWGAYGV
jgi:hypothetical protein